MTKQAENDILSTVLRSLRSLLAHFHQIVSQPTLFFFVEQHDNQPKQFQNF